MVQQQAALLKPETMVEEFQKNGVTHVVTIPDSETNYLYELMKDRTGWTSSRRRVKARPSRLPWVCWSAGRPRSS